MRVNLRPPEMAGAPRDSAVLRNARASERAQAANRWRPTPYKKARRPQPAAAGVIEEALVRTVTRPYLRTEVKSELTRLRESLDPEDQLLLILRLDKDLAWRDIALVFADGDADADLERLAATLRKRFQSVKDRLRQMARKSGLTSGD